MAASRVEQRLVHVDVDHLGAAVDLLAGDLDGLAVAAVADQPGEGARAGDVGPLADVDEERVRADVERLQAAEAGCAARRLGGARGVQAFDRVGDRARCGPASCRSSRRRC